MKLPTRCSAFAIAFALQFTTLGYLQAGTSGVVLVKETVPDGATLKLGQEFTKSWTVKSAGGVALPKGSELRYVSGQAGCNHATVTAISVVPPVDYTFAISCTAPRAANTYREDWQLGSGKFWVSIKVDTTDAATLISETIPKGTIMSPGQSYTKQWTLKNSGNTTWGAGFELQYASGNVGCSHDSLPATGSVPPDGTFVFSINCVAPSAATSYRGDWKLVSPRGAINVVSGGTLTTQFAVGGSGKLALTSRWQQNPPTRPTVTPGQSLTFVVTVKDAQGKPVSNAQVPLSDGLGQVSSSIVTGADGTAQYVVSVPNLPAGSYTLTFGAASKPGYTSSDQTKNSVTIAAPLPAPKPTCKLTSQTVATTPPNRARTRIGVGEDVSLTFSPGIATWTSTGKETLSATSGASVTFTAADRAESETITGKSAAGAVCSITFAVVEPSGVVMRQYPGTTAIHTVNRPDSGLFTEIFLTPADVSFRNVQYHELDIPSKADGVYARFNGVGHRPNPLPVTVGDVVSGLGSRANARDEIYSGDSGAKSPFVPGSITFNIPYEFSVGSGTFKRFTTVTQRSTLAADGHTLTSSKAGASVKIQVTDKTMATP